MRTLVIPKPTRVIRIRERGRSAIAMYLGKPFASVRVSRRCGRSDCPPIPRPDELRAMPAASSFFSSDTSMPKPIR